jgi:hypothetical protein
MAIVTLYDIDEDTLSNWARANCFSFVSWYITENDPFVVLEPDVEWTVRYEFEFTDEQEALLFQLRWQGQ